MTPVTLHSAQVLVVSVTGTPNRPDGVSFLDDFVEAALLAKEAGEPMDLVATAGTLCPALGWPGLWVLA